MANIKERTKRIIINGEKKKEEGFLHPKVIFARFMDSLEIAEPIIYKSLAVFPVFRKEIKKVEKLMILPEAIKAGIVEIKETGTVAEIKIINKSKDIKVLIIEGMTVKGGAQNRVINTTIILDENSKTKVPTSCVEERRWEGFDKPFKNDIDYVAPSIHKTLHETVGQTLMASHGMSHSSDQPMLWQVTSNYLCEAGVNSDTADFHKAYEDKKEDVDKILGQISKAMNDIQPQNRLVGIVSIIGGKDIYGDLSADRDIARVQIPIVLKSHILEVVSRHSEVSKQTSVEELVDALNDIIPKAKFDIFDSANKVGKDVRFKIDKLSGSALVYKDELIHMSILGSLKV